MLQNRGAAPARFDLTNSCISTLDNGPTAVGIAASRPALRHGGEERESSQFDRQQYRRIAADAPGAQPEPAAYRPQPGRQCFYPSHGQVVPHPNFPGGFIA